MKTARLIFELSGSPGFVRVVAREQLAAVSLSAQALSLERVPVSDADLESLFPLSQLRCLDLDGTQVTESLAAIANLPALEELWLECTVVTDAGVQALANAPLLRFVSLAHTEVTERGVERLVSRRPGLEVAL